ncbi:uncharacterized protein LOC143290006 isoform X3 [Babylonia areolata]|uniref:uncharacterized protein LOC143290006 isoform X3 n=1 Tax=Babylonia areolata TaxID=304850 RepID=UPI003FD2798D
MVGLRRGGESEAVTQRGSTVAQLLQNVHGGALLDAATTPRRAAQRSPRRLSLDSCRHQQGKTRVYVRSKDCADSAVDPVAKETERLQAEVEEVNRTLTYIRAVVQQEKLEILPHSATLILDTVMNVFNTLRNTPAASDSTALVSCQSKVCQSLARFIHWTDSLLVAPQDAFNKDNARDIIDTLSAGIKELSELWLDKMTNHKATTPKSPPASSSSSSSIGQGPHLAPPHDGIRRVSLPDIPLTPREQEILVQTSELGGNYDNLDGARNASSSSSTGGRGGAGSMFTFDHDPLHHHHHHHTDPGAPPPKPPLPATANNIVPKLLQQHQGGGAPDVTNGDDLIPPPLPQKRRSHNEMMSSLGSLGSSLGSGQTTPTGPGGLAGSDLTLGSTASSSSSRSSNLDFSGEDLRSSGLSSGGVSSVVVCRSSSSSTYTRTSSETRITSSLESRNSGGGSGGAGKPFEEINALTSEIKRLTSSIEDIPPPLPAKKGTLQRLMSQYDNMPDGAGQTFSSSLSSSVVCSSTTVLTSRTVISRTMESSTRYNSATAASSSSSSSQPPPGLQRAPHSAASFLSEERASSSLHETYSSSETFSSASHSSTESLPKPPPLPPKKRHIHAYMETFGALTQPLSMESISRHSINFYEAQWQQHQMELCQPLYPRSNTISVFSDISSDSSFSSGSPERFSGMAPALPMKTRRSFEAHRSSQVSTGSSQSESSSCGDFTHSQSHGALNLMDLDPKKLTGQLQAMAMAAESAAAAAAAAAKPSTPTPTPTPSTPTPGTAAAAAAAAAAITTATPSTPTPTPTTPAPSATTTAVTTTTTNSGSGSGVSSPSVTVSASTKPEIPRDADSDFAELNPLDDVDVSDQLVRKKEGEDGPEIRGGSRDALIVHATAAGKTEFIYQEAFLTTYRTFISPRDLIDKLLYRFHKFHQVGDGRKKLARNSFSLLIRVIDELGHAELDEEIVEKQVALVYELLCQGELVLARLLRRKILEKCEKKQAAHDQPPPVNPVQNIDLSSSTPDLLSFKTQDIAEQMTLLDAQLFQKIEIPEVLLWAKEQSEEQSPNLTTFTEHFNKMSYWCRTRILTQEDPKERERYLMKFIKIMRCLRKLKNFNSYLAILSALDSAPVRRLEWQKQNIEALQEFCQLIDSSSSFRAYRQALAETEPPCIPYLGLILQDLTFINIGNQDALPDGSINFAKRWQQFNILDSMRRFKTSQYGFRRNDKLQGVLNNFDDYRGEEVLWQMSQKIKPRAAHKKQDSIT